MVGESQKLDRILLYVDSRGFPTTGQFPSVCEQSGSPHSCIVSFFVWTVRESPQLDRILSVDNQGVPTTGPYPFCGQSGSPHKWTDKLSKSQSQQADRNGSSCRIVGSLPNTGDGPIHLPHCLFLTRTQTRNTPSVFRNPYPALHPASPSYSCEYECQVAVIARRQSVVMLHPTNA